MSLAELAAMPRREAEEWERFALEGPGDYQFGLALAKILFLADAALGRGRLKLEQAAPWLDGVYGDAEEIRKARREEEEQSRIAAAGEFARSVIRRQRERRNG